MRVRTLCAWVALSVLAAPAIARANTPEDIMGTSSRVVAMGGAGTGISDDYSSVYYNPASLTFCPNRSFSVNLAHAAHGLTLNAQPDDPELEEVRDQTRATVGFCTGLPYGLAFGMLFGTGLQNPMTLDQTTLSADPQYVFYGEAQEQLSIMLGLGWRIFDELAIGVGAAILINSGLVVEADIPVVGTDEEVSASLHWDLKPTTALYAGLRYQPIEQLSLGLTYRSALFHDLDANALVDVDVASVFLEVDLLLESAAWYSPQQVAIGGAVSPIPALTIAADVTWYDWSNHPGPFIVASPADTGSGSVAAALAYAPREDYGFTDVWVPRLGVEYVFEDVGASVRAGYAHRPSPLPIPDGRSNLLDGATNALTLGAGYRFGDRDDSPPNSAFGPMVDPSEQPEMGEVSDEGGINGSVDVHFRYQAMETRFVRRTGGAEQEVLNDYSFGGSVLDVGLTLTVGWF